MKKINGSVSLFAAMIFLLVVSVVTAAIQSARVLGAGVMVTTSLNMGLDSLFTNYDKELFSQFGVMLLKGAAEDKKVDKDMLSGMLGSYMSYNLEPDKGLYFASNTDLLGIEVEGIAIDDYVRATDGGGLIWQNMVVNHEKYAKPINLAAEYLGLENQTAESKAVDNICGGMNNVSSEIMVVNKNARALIEKIDGIVCGKNGIDQDNPGMVARFFKQFCPFERTKEGLNIPSQKIVDTVKCNLNNPLTLINTAINKNSCGEDFDKQIKTISKNAASAQKYLDEAIVLITNVETSQKSIDKEIENLDKLIKASEHYLEEETLNGIMEQYEAVCAYNEILTKDICDINKMSKGLKYNKEVLTQIYNCCTNMNFEVGYEINRNQLSVIKDLILSISYEGICFNYDNLQPAEDNTDILDEIKEFLEVGIMSLLVPEGTKVSTRKFDVSDLASTVVDVKEATEIQKNGNINNLLTKRIVYTEYVMDKFISFTDKKEGTALNYEVEYILFGNKKDVDNLTAAAFTMATIRSGTNMVYLITDSDKRNSAYQVAFNLVGTAKYEPVIRVVQFALMYLWAYAEAILDVKILLEGKEITMAKSDETWQLSIENLLTMNMEGEAVSQNGIDYENFLRLLLHMKEDGKKSAYTMDLVELWMINKGHKKFRLKYYLFGIEAKVSYKVASKYSYIESAAYTY